MAKNTNNTKSGMHNLRVVTVELQAELIGSIQDLASTAKDFGAAAKVAATEFGASANDFGWKRSRTIKRDISNLGRHNRLKISIYYSFP